MRIGHYSVAALLALCCGTARAQDAQIPKELALALIPYGGTDGGEIIVGQLPPDLAETFTIPPGGRVLGSFVSLTYAQVVIAVPGRPDSASAFARRSLTEHGWTPRQPMVPRMGGLQYTPQQNSVPATFCKNGSPDAMTVTTQFHGPTTLLRLTRTTGSSICDPDMQRSGILSNSASISFGTGSGVAVGSIEQRMAQMPLATVPPLYSPSDFRVSQVCRTAGGMSAQSQSQRLKTELTPEQILAHYGKQLDSAGWKRDSGDATSVAGSWGNPATGQQLTISIAKLGDQTGCYDVTLSATPRRSTK